MIDKRISKKIVYALMILVLFIVVMVGGGWGNSSAFAYTTVSSASVMSDLQKDVNFDSSDYPSNSSDYSIQLIQIAESTNKELFVYTYQPSQLTNYLVATQINMAFSESVDGTQLYGLSLLSCEGVFCKYKVDGVTANAEEVRYYNITSIYRKWDVSIDLSTGNNNTKDEVAYSVGKLYKATTSNGAITYSCKETETIQIINPYVDYLEYSNGFKFFPNWCHSHYVAFSTDKKIDTLMEADVSYVRRSASRATGIGLKGETNYKDESQELAQLDGKQVGGNEADGWFAKKYEWERIQRVSDFIAQEDLKDETKANLDGKQWVLRFVETEITMVTGDFSTVTFWTDISQVTILRLKFITDGKVYNLGAVSDKVTGDDKPGNNNTNEFASLLEWLSRLTNIPQWALVLIAVVIVLVILMPILSIFCPVIGQVLVWILKIFGKGLVYLLKGLWLLVCLPFKIIATLFHKITESKGGG